MPFANGPISFTMCKLSKDLPEDVLERFSNKRGYSLDSVLDEPQIGWVSSRHLLDTQIDEETAFSGGYLHLVLRSAVRKIPPSLFNAECRLEELTLLDKEKAPSISRKQKKEIRESIKERLLKTMPPTLKGIPFVVDSTKHLLYLGTTSSSQIDQFTNYFLETVDFGLIQLVPEIIAEDFFSVNPDTVFTLPISTDCPLRREGEKSLGRDFATWMWYFQEIEGGTFSVDDLGSFSIMVDGPLSFADNENGGQEAVVRKGLPTISAEAQSALLSGKKLQHAKFTLVRDDEVWEFTLDATGFGFRSMRLPEIEELEPHSQFQERVKYLNIFQRAFFHLFEHYLKIMTNKPLCEPLIPKIQDWIKNLRMTEEDLALLDKGEG